MTHHKTISQAITSLQHLSDLFCERREQLAREAGLTVQQWCILEKISEEHFMPSMFARDRESSAAAVSKVIRQLLDKGVIGVQVREKDGRQRHYTLTAEGERIVEQLRTSRQRAIDAVWSNFDEHKLNQFTQFSTELCQRLDTYIRDQRVPGFVSTSPGHSELCEAATASTLPEPAAPALMRSAIVSTNKFID